MIQGLIGKDNEKNNVFYSKEAISFRYSLFSFQKLCKEILYPLSF